MKIRTEGIAWQEIDGELVILDLKSSNYLKTNGTGTVLARALQAESNEDDLVLALTNEYDVDAETAHHDVSAFVAQLADLGLLE